jgi:azurin
MKQSMMIMGAALLAAAGMNAQAAPRVIEVTGDDTMKFSVTEIDAKPGEALEVAFANVGSVPREAMAHNFVLLKPMTDEEVGAFAAAAAAKAPTFLPDDQSAVLAHTKTLGPKETDKVDFSAPAKPGEYPFICTFPGHYMLMHGKLIVK